jgi:2,4-dienoyl-CoA reductase-like NADH-dependent reductase (Old Yellow Enzyme family)
MQSNRTRIFMTMPNKLAHLLSPLDLHGLSLRNRVVMAPLTRARAGVTRVPNDLMQEYYIQRASAGLIISEAVTISEQGFAWHLQRGASRRMEKDHHSTSRKRNTDFHAALALRPRFA